MTDPTGRTIRGIVADVSSTILVLVSFTGNRFRISPSGLINAWHFSQSPPNTTMRCTRQGCTHPGILRFTRGQVEPVWVCPRHLPVGVQATLTTESIGATRPPPEPRPPPPGVAVAEFYETPIVRCLGCQSPDPVEDQRVRLPPAASIWLCTRCNERWCFIRPYDNTVQDQAIIDILNEVRVALSIENYNVQEAAVTNAVYRIFERVDVSSGPRSALGCNFDGIPMRWAAGFAAENPAGVIMRLRLGGGPEHRVPARPSRAAMLTSNFEAAYSPGSGRPIIQGSPIGPIADINASSSDANGLLAEMAPTPFVSKGSRWVNKGTGEVVEVAYLGRSTDGGEPVVHFKRVSDSLEANMVLLTRDFEEMFRPFTQDTTRKGNEAVVEVLKDEEWEHIESQEVVKIDSVDTKRNLVIVLAKEKRKSLPMLDFVNAKWRKIIRRTAYARLLEDD